MRELDFRQHFLGEWKSHSAELYALAELACREYDRRCDLSEDLERSPMVKRGFPSYHQIHREEVNARYPDAARLGFEGDMYAWRQFVMDQRPRESSCPK